MFLSDFRWIADLMIVQEKFAPEAQPPGESSCSLLADEFSQGQQRHSFYIPVTI
jgi:hypothetical protein